MSKKSGSLNDMKDQLKAWVTTHDEVPDRNHSAPPAAAPVTTMEGPAEEPVLSDEELFAQAVAEVGDGAVMKKFDDEEAPRKKGDPAAAASPDEPAPVAAEDASAASDARLFLDAVEDVTKETFGKKKR